MQFFKEELKTVKGFIFDVDGVLSCDYSPLDTDGNPMRTSNVKDGYAIRLAIQQGYMVAIITGGVQKAVELRHRKLGVEYYYDNTFDKITAFDEILQKTNLKAVEILYMGDDLPDIPVMQKSGIATCPSTAVPEVKQISHYVSALEGGKGCVRDVIEQVMRVQSTWPTDEISLKQAF